MSPTPLASGGRSRRVVLLLLVLALVAGACFSLRRDDQFSVRYAEYLERRPEMGATLAEAMAMGHVAAGMDPEQVIVVLGRPIERVSYGGTPPWKMWLYPGHRLHQDHHRSGGATLFRAVFRDGRLAFIEPI